MRSCDEYQAGIVALFDNEAGDEALRLTADHLQDCPQCRAFCLDLIALRRTLASAGVPSLPSAARGAVLDGVTAGRSDRRVVAWVKNPPYRWAAVLVIGLLSIACFTLNRTAKDLRTRLGAAEREVAAIHEQAKSAESQERQQKAMSALYFRIAELEDRVNRSSPPQRSSFPTQAYERPVRQSNL
jgi:predicted anti-sigma-YlaC factor YlaD